MTILTSEQIAQYRSELASDPEALAALDEVEACDNSLEDAAEVLAIESGYTKSTLAESDQSYLDKLTEKARKVICSKYTGDLLELFKDLRDFMPFPANLATLVAINVTKIGVNKFCESSESEA
ncbi:MULTISPECIES: hypothetical protein [unclassified Microcoleus]|uniref:hypothetical protein n=1 Tax=unclassified Microcoleus TaxID=2642155 RepID=UPI002FD68181